MNSVKTHLYTPIEKKSESIKLSSIVYDFGEISIIPYGDLKENFIFKYTYIAKYERKFVNFLKTYLSKIRNFKC